MLYIIIGITVLISLLAMNNGDLMFRLRFNPYLALHSRQYYRFFTYGLVHAGWMHLGVNMYVLYSFGQFVLRDYVDLFDTKGYYYFGLLYVGAILMSVLPSFGKHKNDPYYNAVGASGAVSAVVFASILFNPTNKITIFPVPIGIPSFIFGILYLIYSAYMGKRGKDNIGHDAHFWGAVYGVVFTIALEPRVGLFFIHEIRTFLGL